MRAIIAFNTSVGSITRTYYAALAQCRPFGAIAVALLRAQKNSARAKKYHGGPVGGPSFRRLAYERKAESLAELCRVLAGGSFEWGWKEDPGASFAPWVLYVDLPNGQVSFHALARGTGPTYAGEWDRQHASAERILAFCDQVMGGEYAQASLYESASGSEGDSSGDASRSVRPGLDH